MEKKLIRHVINFWWKNESSNENLIHFKKNKN